MKNKSIKIAQLADDTTIMVKNTQSIPQVLEQLNRFEQISGLKANVEKTKAFAINCEIPHKAEQYNLKWANGPMHLLGIHITDNMNIHVEMNLLPKIEIMKNTLNIWKQRNLTIKGKITVINSLAISLFVYPATLMTFPKCKMKEIEQIFYDFLWRKGKHKVAKHVIESKIETGGLKMPNIYNKVKSWQFTWLKRATCNPNSAWVLILDDLLEDISFVDIIKCNKVPQSYLRALPSFYREILTNWFNLRNQSHKITDTDIIANQLIWFNKDITIAKKPFFWKTWYQKGIIKVKDFLDESNLFLSHEQLSQNITSTAIS